MRRKLLISVSVFVAIFIFTASSISVEFWGSKNSNKYHYPTCRWAKKIKPSNLITFKSPEEAVKAGYVPCKVCKPPLPKKSESEKIDNVKIADNTQVDINERRGCCSWHGGVCGCDETNHRIIYHYFNLNPSYECDRKKMGST